LLTHFSQVTPINKRLAPNLRRLKIEWFTSIINLESVNKLFERDVLFSLTNFTLLATIADPYVLQNLLSMLSNQCLYSFGVNWFMTIAVLSSLEINKILSDIYQQLKGPVPIELELSLEENMYQTYRIRAVTVPRMDKCLCVYFYLHKNTVHRYIYIYIDGYFYRKPFFLYLVEVGGPIITVSCFAAKRLL
jgi:hypothetical protein